MMGGAKNLLIGNVIKRASSSISRLAVWRGNQHYLRW
jgi:hypothetical protein